MSSLAANTDESGKVGPGNPPVETRWKPGQSGNPTGRPKGVARAFREVMGTPTQAAQGLLEIATSEKSRPQDRISAWRELLDRGYGRAASFAAIEGADPLELDAVAAEITAIADELRSRREAKNGSK